MRQSIPVLLVGLVAIAGIFLSAVNPPENTLAGEAKFAGLQVRCGDTVCSKTETADLCPQDCAPPCRDSDGGKNYAVQGTTSGSTLCSYQPACNANPVSLTDSCNGTSVVEYYCNNGHVFSENNHVCPYGCQNGRCVEQTGPVCGNNVVELGEACDAGLLNGPCPSACSSTCTRNTCGAIVVSSCTTITAPGKYQLDRDIISLVDGCISILNTHDVHLDCGGKRITGSNKLLRVQNTRDFSVASCTFETTAPSTTT